MALNETNSFYDPTARQGSRYSFQLRKTPPTPTGAYVAYKMTTGEIRARDILESVPSYLWEKRYLDIYEGTKVVASTQKRAGITLLTKNFLYLWIAKFGYEMIIQEEMAPQVLLESTEKPFFREFFT